MLNVEFGLYNYNSKFNIQNSTFPGPVAQLDRASDSGSEGWGFESLRDHPGAKTTALFSCQYFDNTVLSLIYLLFIFLVLLHYFGTFAIPIAVLIQN